MSNFSRDCGWREAVLCEVRGAAVSDRNAALQFGCFLGLVLLLGAFLCYRWFGDR